MFTLALLAGYFAGSIPFGLLLGFAIGMDIRREGSRNIGATNVFRVCGAKLGLFAFALDFLKGLAAVLWISRLGGGWPPAPYAALLTGVAAVLGHAFPVWLRFKGGKGVATSAGAMAGLMWLPFLAALAVFVATVFVWRYISLGSMLSSVALVIAAAALLREPFGADLPLLAVAFLLAALILVRHRSNISRIMAGTENRFPPPKK